MHTALTMNQAAPTACRTSANPWDMPFPLCVGNMWDRTMFCSPWPAPFPPQPPQKVALPCSAGSQVLRHSPASPARACPHYVLWPSRTGHDCISKACWRSRGSRACCFSACEGSSTTQDLNSHLRISRLPCCLPYSPWSQRPDLPVLRSSIAPPTDASVLRFKRHLTMSPARLEARMESLLPFL
jgi:hypothetical protein